MLSPPATLRYEVKNRVGQSPENGSCTPALPACGDAARIDIGDIVAAIADPDVQQALAQPTAPDYGGPVADADWFSFQRGDGKFFGIQKGFECATANADCVPTPPGVHRLTEALEGLLTGAFADPMCAPLR